MAVVTATLCTRAAGDVIYQTDDPFGGPFGLWGADVGLCQSVGMRFTPGGDTTLDRVSVWFMSNAPAGQHPSVDLTLRPDDDSVPGVSVPGDTVIEAWSFNVQAVGWNPVLEVVDSTQHPTLTAGVPYWIVAESTVTCGIDGVWNFASAGLGFSAFSIGFGQPWQSGGSGAALAASVEGTPVALAPGDIDGDGDVDADDAAAFVAVLLDAPLAPEHVARCDLDHSGGADGRDIQMFVNFMLGG